MRFFVFLHVFTALAHLSLGPWLWEPPQLVANLFLDLTELIAIELPAPKCPFYATDATVTMRCSLADWVEETTRQGTVANSDPVLASCCSGSNMHGRP